MKGKSKLLLHVCCAPCASYPYEELVNDYEVSLLFFNPNIYPEGEYQTRLDELKKFCAEKNIPLIIEEGEHSDWLDYVREHKDAAEGGARCALCFEYRLDKTADLAESLHADSFASVMSVSPHKNHEMINEKGFAASKGRKVNYLPTNFKKNDGFKKSCMLSKQYGFYRQSYCGCEFSIRRL